MGLAGGGVGAVSGWRIGDPVRIKDDAASEFAGREDVWIRSEDETGDGYYVRVGIADWLWFGKDEIEPRQGVLGL